MCWAPGVEINLFLDFVSLQTYARVLAKEPPYLEKVSEFLIQLICAFMLIHLAVVV